MEMVGITLHRNPFEEIAFDLYHPVSENTCRVGYYVEVKRVGAMGVEGGFYADYGFYHVVSSCHHLSL